MPEQILLNPCLAENLSLTCQLVEKNLGQGSGKLAEYKSYPLTDSEGRTRHYVLTHPLLQFTLAPALADNAKPQRIIDIFEPTHEGEGGYGKIYPVLASILFKEGQATFSEQAFVVKKIQFAPCASHDKPNKPPAPLRAIHREQYLASHFLGAYFSPIIDEEKAFLHLERAPGKPLTYYTNKLNAAQFLSLACALLEHIPQQLSRMLSYGKHQGKHIVHCDVSASNIMADFAAGKWTVQLVDFGVAKAIEGDKSYQSKQYRGRLWYYDATMFRAALGRRAIDFNYESDLYALYNILVNLAGSSKRAELSQKPEELLAELKSPSLDGLFMTMSLAEDVKIDLIALMASLIHPNKNQRPSPQEALARFKKALASVDTSTLTSPFQQKTIKTLPSFEELWVEPIKPAASELTRWLKDFRTNYNSLNETEKTELIKEFNQKKAVIYYYAVYLQHFELFQTYPEETIARLIMRHVYLLSPIIKGAARFNALAPYSKLIGGLPLLVSESDAQWCASLAEFQSLHFNVQQGVERREETLPLFSHLESILKEHDWTPFNTHQLMWCFTGQYELLEELNGLFDAYQNFVDAHALSSTKWPMGLKQWFTDFTTRVVQNGESPPELEDELDLRVSLIKQLEYFTSYFLASDEPQNLRVLGELGGYSLEDIKQLISDLDFQDSRAIRQLIQKISIIPYLTNMAAVYPSLSKLAQQSLTAKLHALLAQPDAPDLKIQVVNLGEKLVAYASLNQTLIRLSNEKEDLDGIKSSIPYLLADLDIAQRALTLMPDPPIPGLALYLIRLNIGLERVIKQSKENLGARILNEYELFFQDPIHYSPYKAVPGQSHRLFPALKKGQEDNELTQFDHLHLF
ncbi:protein kinase [Legionella sp. km772]|uniref:protein kinase domain-containing protein n=1 Tax=Legionella sp. km772 TaxID=2498111 RepID=UPI000F8EEC18|nr:protein kinase [Legionella sp. km772]RUR09522.1 protein kinase family protein [Legionella sp. km772]